MKKEAIARSYHSVNVSFDFEKYTQTACNLLRVKSFS